MTRERKIWVQVDVHRVIKNAEMQGVQLSASDAARLLKMLGFDSREDGWVCNESDLRYLRGDEIRSKRVWEAGK